MKYLIDEFSVIPRLKLNISKFEGLWLGPLRTGHIQFTKKNVLKYLGIFIGHDQNECVIRYCKN